MAIPELDLDLNIDAALPANKDRGIGCIGAGFIMRDCHLVAYRSAGFRPVAIASRTRARAEEVAKLREIPKVFAGWRELIMDPEVEILDIAFPPDQQLEIVSAAVRQKHIKGILVQKPIALNYSDAVKIVQLCADAGIKLGVNSNMRYDQSIRALKTLLNRGYLGEPVLATIDMRAIPHWQPYLEAYDRLTLLNMSIHHIDAFRYLFGDPQRVIASARTDPRTTFRHSDGIVAYIFEYSKGLRAMSLDDVWAWPGPGTEKDIYIKWRVEGTEGMARGSIGWPGYPAPTPSTIDFTMRSDGGQWHMPRWDKVWFPDAFVGTMAQLLCAVENGTVPEISGEDNLITIAAVEACYRSIRERRAVELQEIIRGSGS
ncbi:MAG: Gfo/Idh/MocA family oxidoreductase [Spirochaetota bacterium]